jgi:hypothetical protein
MIRAYTFLLRPTARQEQGLADMPLPGRGHVAKENRATQAMVKCTARGFHADAGHAGAFNALQRTGPALRAQAWPPTRETRDNGHG